MFDTDKDVSYYYEKWPVLVLMVWPSETDVIIQAIITLDGLVLWRMSNSGWSVVLFCLHCWLSEVLVLGFEKSSWTTFCSGGDGRWPSVWGSSQHESRICCSSPPRNGGVLCWLSPPGLVLSFPRFLWQHITHTNRTGWTIQVALLGVVCGHLFLPF